MKVLLYIHLTMSDIWWNPW